MNPPHTPATAPLKPLFWYAGGKRFTAAYVWRAIGNPTTYIEPFTGSAAVLLARPTAHLTSPGRRIEIINDINGRLVNLWRALQSHPEQVWQAAQGPRTLIDMNCRHKAIAAADPDLTTQLLSHPHWCDPQLAGWQLYTLRYATHPRNSLNSTRRTIGRPAINPPPITRQQLADVAARLTCTRLLIMCHDWSKTLTPALTCNRPVAVFLDPPYLSANRDSELYRTPGSRDDGRPTAAAARQWAIDHADDPTMRIVLAGYDDEGCPPGWTAVAWSSAAGGASRHNERLWLSPHCQIRAFDATQTLSLYARPERT